MAQPAPTFTRTGNLITPRAGHTATLLPNGKVLIAGGGTAAYTWLASAELYDPSTGTFTQTGDMTTPRVGHRATLLPNGKVLISGGVSAGSPFTIAELYDPSTGTFIATGNMTTPRVGHIASLLYSGKVLIAGGVSTKGYLSSAELYDSSTGVFTPTGDLTEPGAGTGTLLPNGNVLITRSVDAGPNHAELYDPSTGQFTRTVDLLSDATGPAAVLLTNGRVLITGGYTDSQDGLPDRRAELYDPATGVFTATNSMTDGVEFGAATLLSEGSVFIAGSVSPAGTTLACCQGATELYSPVSGTFSSSGDPQAVLGEAVTLLPNGTVLLSGGFAASGATLNTAELYHPAVVVRAPNLFSVPGGRQGAILHAATQQLVSPSNPATAGEVVEIFGAGLIDGSVIPPQVAVGGTMAEVVFFGGAPGFPGLNQINVRVPRGIQAGPEVAVRLTYLGRPSNEVTIGVQ